MASKEPRPYILRNGVKQYEISEEEYLDPGQLVDTLLHEVSMQGVFIERLKTWTTEDAARNVEEVKAEVKKDVAMETFHPEWLRRKTLLFRKAFQMDPVHDQTVAADVSKNERNKAGTALRRLQTSMKKNVEEFDFFAVEDDHTVLGKALASGGLDDCLDVMVDTLEGKQNDIVYVTNMTMKTRLQTTRSASMRDMQTNLSGLSQKDIAGITKPTVYLGTEFSTFGCHREDMAFCAYNRHIAGGYKIWFSIPPRFYSAFVRFLTMLPVDEREKALMCLLLHKVFWVDPRMVIKAGIPVYTIVQRPGDSVVLLPNTIHWGFNVNYNLNEAVNFVSKSWILPGMTAIQRCKCNELWYAKFELRQVFNNLQALPEHIKDLECGKVFKLHQILKKEHPLLYPHLKDMGDEPENENLEHGHSLEGQPEGGEVHREERQESALATCTRCSYCPRRYMGDAPERIYTHAVRCHGEEAAREVLKAVMEKYGGGNRTYKTKGHDCEYCGKNIKGNITNMRSHQRSRNCNRPQECGTIKRRR